MEIIFKLFVDFKLLGKASPSEKEQKRIFIDIHTSLKEVERMLSEHIYLVKDSFTFCDVLLYNDIEAFIELMKMTKVDKSNYELDQHYLNTSIWLKKHSEDSIIKETDKMFYDALVLKVTQSSRFNLCFGRYMVSLTAI